jgi:DNA end-binding protein Ku
MAEMLIDNLAAHFDPARYRDEYRDAVVHLVEDKLNNRPPERAPAPAAAQITDLMAALRASVEAASRQRQAAEVEEEPPGRAAAAGRRRRAS